MPDNPNDLHVTNTRGFFENCEFDFCTIFCLCLHILPKWETHLGDEKPSYTLTFSHNLTFLASTF